MLGLLSDMFTERERGLKLRRGFRNATVIRDWNKYAYINCACLRVLGRAGYRNRHGLMPYMSGTK